MQSKIKLVLEKRIKIYFRGKKISMDAEDEDYYNCYLLECNNLGYVACTKKLFGFLRTPSLTELSLVYALKMHSQKKQLTPLYIFI